MVAAYGLVGLRPAPQYAARVAAPPYDVIKPGSPLERLLAAEPLSLYHVVLGPDPKGALDRLVAAGGLVRDDEPAFYVYEQRWNGGERVGVLFAGEVTPYEARQIVRHEKTFDDKVEGRIRLKLAIGHHIGPVFLLARTPLLPALREAMHGEPLYAFRTDLGGLNDLHGIDNRVWRVPETSAAGRAIQRALAAGPLYIADGHHRYHAALRANFARFVGYATEQARPTAYNRVVRGTVPFREARRDLALEPTDAFRTPPKHAFCVYAEGRAWMLRARHVPDDPVGRLDCSILERELYPALGLRHEMIKDPRHFDYYPEAALDEMRAVVDAGRYDLAIALHPVSLDELFAVADAGLDDPNVVMPEKSTFFSPKILSGLFLQRVR
ncbi:MAG: DUF1015 family protein [Myxococcales bacterium]|nr:DUF1015 family protein [Myxococcales bacterium]